MIRRLRLITGLVLFAYVGTHLINHALGLISLPALGHGPSGVLALVPPPVGTVALECPLAVPSALCPVARDARPRSRAGRRITGDGVVIIKAQRFRSQDRNRADAIERLVSLIRRAAEPQRSRRATAPTKASIHRRLDAKARQGRAKQLRGPVGPEE